MKRYLTEFIGTLFLVLTIGLSVLGGSPLAPLAIGVALTAMVYMGGHVSGAHYNPAVSMAMLLAGKFAAKDFIPYVVSQLAGAIAAALLVLAILGRTFAPAPGAGFPALSALLVETAFTFALALVVLNVGTIKANAGNSFYGIAIGSTVMAGAFAGGGVSGGAFNPAVGAGPILVQSLLGGGSFANLWLYLVGPFVGGALAAAAFRVQGRS